MRCRLLFILVFLSNGLVGKSQEELLDSLLFDGYANNDSATSQHLFSNAKQLINNEEDLANYYYFKCFYHYKNNHADSTDYYAELAKPLLLKQENFPRYFRIVNNEFWMLDDMGNSEASIKLAQEMIHLAEEHKQKEYVIKFRTNLSNAYHNINFFEKGVTTAQEAVTLSREMEPYDPFLEFISLNVMAINYDDWGKVEEAIATHRKALALPDIHPETREMCLNNIGNSFIKLNELDSAEKYIKASVRINQKYRGNYGLATSMNNLADVWLRKNYLDSVKFYLDSAEYFAITSASLEKKRDVYNTLYRYYEKVGNSTAAVDYLNRYHQVKDQMVNAEKLQVIENLEKEALKQEKEIELRTRNLWIAVSILVVITLLFLLRQAHLRRKRLAQEARLKLQEERLRISRDLHDNIGAELSYMSSVIDQKLYSETNEETKRELEQLGETSKNAMSQLRETIWAVQTEEITLHKFTEKLRQLSRKYTQLLDLELIITYKGKNHLLEPAQVISLFRICQEALNNAIKYANCNQMHFTINGMPQSISILITDNGKGFDLETVERGYGLNNMEERSKELKGNLAIHSEKGKGTRITIEVPLSN